MTPEDEDRALEQAPEFVEGRRVADEQIAAGDLGTPLADVMAELEGEHDATPVGIDEYGDRQPDGWNRGFTDGLLFSAGCGPYTDGTWRSTHPEASGEERERHALVGLSRDELWEYLAAERASVQRYMRVMDSIGELAVWMTDHGIESVEDVPRERYDGIFGVNGGQR